MKAVIVTSDEPFYLPMMINDVVKGCRHEIAAIMVESPVARNSSWPRMMRQFLDFYGPAGFAKMALRFAAYKGWRAVSEGPLMGRFVSVRSVARHYKIPLFDTANINDETSLDTLRAMKPDIIVSISPTQIFKRKVLDLPRYGIINVHGAPLPKYRGLMPSFWMLYNGERQGAVTVHVMDEKLDNGDIIAQQFYDIGLDETQHTLILKSKKVGAQLVRDVLDIFEKTNGKVPLRPNPIEESTYFGFPDKQEARDFRRMGKKFF